MLSSARRTLLVSTTAAMIKLATSGSAGQSLYLSLTNIGSMFVAIHENPPGQQRHSSYRQHPDPIKDRTDAAEPFF